MERRGYHHGSLREALVRAALQLIAEKGPAGFTFAEAARSAGVSPAAPYRHFRDRDELLADVARRGYERFEGMLRVAFEGCKADPLTGLEELGKAYLAFARTEPAYYAAMFESGLVLEEHPDLVDADGRAMAIFRAAADAVTRSLATDRRPPAAMLALHVRAMAHGIAALSGRGDAARRKLPMAPEELLEAGLHVYLTGLGLRPGALAR